MNTTGQQMRDIYKAYMSFSTNQGLNGLGPNDFDNPTDGAGVAMGARFGPQSFGWNYYANAFVNDAAATPVIGSANLALNSSNKFYYVDSSAGVNVIASEAWVTSEIAAAVTGVFDLQGGYDASSNLFPTAADTNPVVAAIKKGMIWNITVAGTLGGVTVFVGDTVLALVDSPGQTAANWLIQPFDFVILSPSRGGTGINNGSRTLTMAGNHVTLGAFTSTFTFTNTTSVTFPTSGTLATTTDLAGYLPLAGYNYLTTSGNGLAITTSTLTSGNLVDFRSTGNGSSANTQTVFNIESSGTSAQTTFGSRMWNHHSGSGSKNITLQLDTTDGDTNIALLVNSGYLFIGTSDILNSDTSIFQVAGSGYLTQKLNLGQSKWIFDNTLNTVTHVSTVLTTTGHLLSTSTLSSGSLMSLVSTSTAATGNSQTVLSVATSGSNGTSTQTTAAATFANTHTGTSSTNIGATFKASGGSTNISILAGDGDVYLGNGAWILTELNYCITHAATYPSNDLNYTIRNGSNTGSTSIDIQNNSGVGISLFTFGSSYVDSGLNIKSTALFSTGLTTNLWVGAHSFSIWNGSAGSEVKSVEFDSSSNVLMTKAASSGTYGLSITNSTGSSTALTGLTLSQNSRTFVARINGNTVEVGNTSAQSWNLIVNSAQVMELGGSFAASVNGNFNVQGNTTISGTLTTGGIAAVGTSSPYSGAKFQVHIGSDINLSVQSGFFSAGGIFLNSINDAGTLNVPFDINGSILSLGTGGVLAMTIAADQTITIPSLAGTGTRHVVVDASGKLSAP